MKKLLLLLSVVLLSLPVLAQPSGQRFERIRAARAAFITEKLNMTPKQAEAFWPLYNKYENERINIRRSFRQQQQSINKNASDAELRKYIDDNLDYQQQDLELKRKYKDQFLKILSAQQVAALFDAEREFKQMLLQQLNERRGMRNGGRP